MNAVKQYDLISDRYDDLFVDETSLRENGEVAGMLESYEGTFLDIGCGTGLLLELKTISPKDYLGVDPSLGMLSKMAAKHPEYVTSCEPYDPHRIWPSDFQNVVGLFGAPSYLQSHVLAAIASSPSAKFLMFYRDDYHPVTYEKCGVEFSHFVYRKDELESIFGDCAVVEYHNYYIVSSKYPHINTKSK